MTYELAFKASALEEWQKLGAAIREQFKKRLADCLEHPHVPGAALSGAVNLYKIKLRQAGCRRVHAVDDHIVTVTVIAAGKRDRNAVYDAALARLRDPKTP